MFSHGWNYAARAATLLLCLLMCDCGFLPGFGLGEAPVLYYVPVGEAAIRVACETEEFLTHYNPSGSRWVLAQQDIAVKLTLTTDEQGYLNFTGVNAAHLGFAALARLISTTSSVPSLAAKLNAKRTKSVEVDFSVSPTAYSDPTTKLQKWETCARNLETSPSKLYLKEWLNNYFATINFPTANQPKSQDAVDLTTNFIRAEIPPDQLPQQLKIQSVDLSTTLLISADLSAGASPTLVGPGSLLMLPVNGLTLDYNPDYSHKLDMTFTMCDTAVDANQCQPEAGTDELGNKQPQRLDTLLIEQCRLYAKLFPLLSGVKQPKDALGYDGALLACSKEGHYRPKKLNKTPPVASLQMPKT